MDRAWQTFWHTEGIRPYSAVPVVTWDVEMSWKGVGREEFDFFIGLCHHLVSSYHFFCFLTECVSLCGLGKRHKACEGAVKQAVNNHSDTARMAFSTVGTADVALSSKRSSPFRAAQASVDKAIQMALTAEGHKI